MSAEPKAVLAELVERAHALGLRHAQRIEELDETEGARFALHCLSESGLVGFAVPEEFGGHASSGLCARSDISARALCALRDELAWHSGLLDFMLAMQGLSSYAIARAGEPKLRAEVLPDIARGALIGAFALTEPEAGSSLGDIATQADKRGVLYRLNGKKHFISNAGIASYYTVLARTSGEPGDSRGLSMFFVPATTRGIEVTRFEVMAPHPIGEVVFHDVEVPESHRIGTEGQGMDLAVATLHRFRPSVAAAANGFARRALDESRAYLTRRKQFGKPLASFQALRFDVAEMDTRLRAAQLLVDEAAALVDGGDPSMRAVARAKLFATENAAYVCDRAVQHFGGLGVKKGTVVERLYREVRSLRIYEGSSEIQKLILAKEILG